MDDRIEFDRYASAIWRGKWLILATIVVAAVATAAYRYRQPPAFTAEALLRIGRVWKDPLEDPYLTAEIINSQGFLDEVAHKLSIKPAQLRRAIRATAVGAGPQRTSYPILVRILASTDNADQSTRFAETVAGEIVTRHNALFDQAMAPHLDTQHRLEQLEQAVANASIDARVNLERELGQTRAFNDSAAITERTRLLGPVARESVARADVLQPAALAAFLAGLVAVAGAVIVAFLSPQSNRARPGAADKELSDVTSG
jgi:uncharacterized protein involved in exopolysaccharide biosynthesis